MTHFISHDFDSELQLRVERIRIMMADRGIDALLVAGNTNLYYLSGRIFRGYIYLPIEGDLHFFIIRPNDFEAADYLTYVRKPEQIAAWIKESNLTLPKRVGLEFNDLFYSDVERLRKVFPDAEITDSSMLLRHTRMIKTPYEIEKMRQDGLHQAAAYHRITRLYRKDMTDVEFQIEIERALRLEGCLGFYRTAGSLMEINMGSVIAGANADNPTPYDFAMGGAGTDSSLPVGANGTTILPGSTVMVDMNGSFNGYQTDMSRVWALGELPELAHKAHECSRRILRELERIGVPGEKCSRLYDVAVEIAKADGLETYFMGHKQKAAFIGHGVGIELNEQPVLTPRSKDLLEESMTIAIEPKFVIPSVGPVGVENTYVVRPSGLECITPFPEEIQEL